MIPASHIERKYKATLEQQHQDRRFAAAVACLQGMLASAPIADRQSVNKELWARIAYQWSDALLAELAK